jgi:hypothetical protein
MNKKNWIINYGSEYLIRLSIDNIDCDGQYLRERINKELGIDWIIDHKDIAIIKAIFHPSFEAILKIYELRRKGYKEPQVRWLKKFKDIKNQEIILINIYNKNVFLIINKGDNNG